MSRINLFVLKIGFVSCLVLSLGATKGFGQATLAIPEAVVTSLNTELTALDHYVAKPDSSYEWKIVTQQDTPAGTTYVIELTSQTWLTKAEVDRPVWKHWLTILRPANVSTNKALLFIGGGGNGGGPPQGIEQHLAQVALATQSVVAEIKMIPNQPLVFHNDGIPRKEDDLIAYTWDQFLKTGDDRWPARLPMVKSVVRAMDTIQAVLGQSESAVPAVEQFVIAGGSKRGWTTWMTGAVDDRVVAIIPIVIDVLNVDVSMRHHYSAYGFWAPAIGDYVNHQIMERRMSDRYSELLQLVDPFAYRDRLAMPKCVINATGDQFFCPDSSQFYFGDLLGEKHLCYVPNSEHSLDGTNALDTLIAFHYAIAHGIERPTCSWNYDDDGRMSVRCSSPPRKVLLWEAANQETRDFRVDTIGRNYRAKELEADDDGVYRVELTRPSEGWVASFVQCEFDIGAPTPLRLSTEVKVLPERLPFSDKPIPENDHS